MPPIACHMPRPFTSLPSTRSYTPIISCLASFSSSSALQHHAYDSITDTINEHGPSNSTPPPRPHRGGRAAGDPPDPARALAGGAAPAGGAGGGGVSLRAHAR
jgi:hypothetical protein